MDKSEVLKLARLARIGIDDAEAEKLSHEFDAILGYVAEVKKITDPSQPSPNVGEGKGGVYNVMREDAEPHQSGIYTDALLAEAPDSKDGYVVVKKIL